MPINISDHQVIVAKINRTVGRKEDKMPKASKQQRAEVYRDHRVQLLLSKFMSGELKKLEPVYSAKFGYMYPIVEKIVGDAQSANEFLKQLVEVGILKEGTL